MEYANGLAGTNCFADVPKGTIVSEESIFASHLKDGVIAGSLVSCHGE